MENFKARVSNPMFRGRDIDNNTRADIALDASGNAYLVLYDASDNEIIKLNLTQGVRLLQGATVWEDLNFSVVNSQRGVANHPTIFDLNGVYHSSFALNDYVFNSREVFHATKPESEGVPHLHAFIEFAQSVGTTGADFTLYWEIRHGAGNTTSGNVTVNITSAELTSTTVANGGGEISKNFSANIAVTYGDQITLVLKRTGGDAGRVAVTTYGLHCELDGFGSDEIISKT